MLQILAQELGPATNLSTLVNVITYINDLNDNPPVFERDMYVAEIPENITAGRRVTEVCWMHNYSPKNWRLNLLQWFVVVDGLKLGSCHWYWYRSWGSHSIYTNPRLFEYIIEFKSRQWSYYRVNGQSWIWSWNDARISFICWSTGQWWHWK